MPRFVLVFVLGLYCGTSIGMAHEPVFRAGAAAVDITPQKYPVSMTGSFTDRKATGAHDRLHARALVLDDSKTKLAIVVCDSCLIPAEIFDQAKQTAAEKTNIPPDHMLMSATHTHSAPTAFEMAQCVPDPQYVEYLAKQIAASVELANQRLAPAQIGWGVVDIPEEVFNRRWVMNPGSIPADPFGGTTDRVRTNPGYANPDLREPAGPVDPQVSFIAIRSRTGEPQALLASYSLHYVGSTPPGLVSADYFGEFAKQLAERAGTANFVGILANGTSGDINNVNVREAAPKVGVFEKIQGVAARVSTAVDEVAKSAEYRDWVPLAMVERNLELGVRRPDPQALQKAKATIASAESQKIDVIPLVYAKEAIALSQYPERVSMKLQALRIGELAIVAEPCEAFVEVGLDIKRKSPFKNTFVIGLANGYGGYLPTPRHHDLGGYETWPSRWSFLERTASDKITETLLQLLAEIKAGE